MFTGGRLYGNISRQMATQFSQKKGYEVDKNADCNNRNKYSTIGYSTMQYDK